MDFLRKTAMESGLRNWLLFPTSDESVRFVASHHGQLSKFFKLTVPPWDKLRWAVDKRLMHQLADDLDIDHAESFYPRSRDDLRNLKLSFPLLLKPTKHDQVNRLTRDKVWVAENLQRLLARYDEACEFLPAESLMVQELIAGGGECQYSYAAVCKDGHALAKLTARRTRQIPMDFGRASTFVETIEDPGIVEPSERFLAAIRYTGIVEIEFKRDPRTGTLKLLDINPRVWGWYSLCETSGLNFAYLLWLLYQGKPLPEVRTRAGVAWIRISTDLLTSVREILAGRMQIGSYLHTVPAATIWEPFAGDDPLPGLFEFPLLFMLVAKRFLRAPGLWPQPVDIRRRTATTSAGDIRNDQL